MNIFEKNGYSYTRLDDDVSFQILRTNPKLTTNTKLVYDGESLYMDAYPATPLLSTTEYQHHRVWKNGLFNRDIRNFLLGTSNAAYMVGQSVSDTMLLTDFDDQFETLYWCGAEAVNSKHYPQELGFVAPLYLRKKRPNYFVIFRIDTPANTNTNPETNDTTYDFVRDVQNRAKIVKTFDLREGTPIGDYISRYVGQRDFKYDQSVYVNFSSGEIYYYGIDKSSGVLTQNVENFGEQLLENDNTILKNDDWITDGFERNNLIFPYIINLEFLFDDKITKEYHFARYFGMYCNDIDLYDLDVRDCVYAGDDDRYSTVITEWGVDDNVTTFEGDFYYIKDKHKNMYSVSRSVVPNHFISPGRLDVDDFSGFEGSSTTAYVEKMDGVGNAIMILDVKEPLDNGSEVYLYNTIYEDSGNSDSDGEHIMYERTERLGTFLATDVYGKGEYYGNRFSCRGTAEDVAKSLAGVIRTCDTDEFRWVTAYNIGTKVVLKAMYPGTGINELFDISFDRITTMSKKVEKITEKFDGGTDTEGCLFKIYTADKDLFFDNTETDRDPSRYFRCGIGRTNAKIKTVIPYIVDEKYIDDTYSILVTDDYGPYVNISKTNQVEIIDRYYAKFGVLSFFPVKDFDFDTVYSAYGEYTVMRKELDMINTELAITETEDSDSDSDIDVNKYIPYGRFFYYNGNLIGTEYEYYFENIIPELSTVNKTVPFVNKWGYMDDAKDSCENPYRLNMSKIFETSNFSANTYAQRGDIMEYTHSMPYYVCNYKPRTYNEIKNDYKNEYQYIQVDEDLWNNEYSGALSKWEDYFSRKKSDELGDPFEEMFGDTSRSQYNSKRFNKKYSRFLLGDSVVRASTLFRGVKFAVTELQNGKEVHTGRYNDYKFSFIYVPVRDIPKNENKVHFIKNDDYKFIVGIVFFDIKSDPDVREFNKAFVYAGSMGFLDLDEE